MAYVSPGKATGFVNDFSNILTAQDRQAIETKLQSLKQATNAEVSIATIPSIGNDETIETYATKLFQEWGIGVEDKDNGLLMLVAPNDRQARIEVGYGLEGSITDIQSGIIVRNVMIPSFKAGDYSKGINEAVDAVVAIITKSPEAAQYSQYGDANSTQNSSDSNINFAPLFFVVIIFLNVFAKILGKTKSWWLGGVIGAILGAVAGLIWGYVFVGIGSIIILTILGLIFDYFVSKKPPKSGGHGGFFPLFFGGSNSGHGGFGGGGSFGGFGGGMSGGGGASGRW